MFLHYPQGAYLLELDIHQAIQANQARMLYHTLNGADEYPGPPRGSKRTCQLGCLWLIDGFFGQK